MAPRITVETDPLNPDSNSDGIRDGDEFDHGVCRYTESQPRPYAWSDDNDSDNVPDSLDMSPFSKSDELGGKRNTTDDAYTTRIDGANMTFEMVADNDIGAPREVYYYEVQVRPLEGEHLQYAYKSALEWPEDDQGLIQHNLISGTSGLLQIAPFLQVTIDESDLPSVLAMTSLRHQRHADQQWIVSDDSAAGAGGTRRQDLRAASQGLSGSAPVSTTSFAGATCA